MKRSMLLLIPILITGCAYSVDPVVGAKPKGLVISEILTSNGSGIISEFGERSDWIELSNYGETPVNLGEYALSDNEKNRLKWFMADSILNPGQSVLVFASGRDIRSPKPCADRIEMPIRGVAVWSDGDMGGGSFVKSWKNRDILDPSTNVVSAVLFLADNGDKLDWVGDAMVSMIPSNLDNTNLSQCTQLELEGYIEKGKQICIRLPQKSWESQVKNEQYISGASIPVVGTGEENGHYTVQLNTSDLDSMIDMRSISQIIIANQQFNDSVHVAVSKVYFSGTPSAMHASFSLSSEGGPIYLTRKDGTTVDSAEVPQLDPDCSWGRLADRPDLFGFCRKPTPGKANCADGQTAAFGSSVRTPLTSGFYTHPVTVELTADNPGDSVRYTFDGSVPTITSPLYTKPFTVERNRTIRFASFRNGIVSNRVTTRTIIMENAPGIAAVSITVDSSAMFDSLTGIHSKGDNYSDDEPYFGANFWDESLELPASVEFFEGNGKRAFTADLGISIQGNYSRMAKKKGFALISRKKYGGDEIHYPLFPNHPQLRDFKSFILRPGSEHQQGALFYDAYRTALTEGMGIPYQKYRPVILYLNGEYRGLYCLQEKLNESYFETNYGADADRVSVIKENGVIQCGTADDYVSLVEYVQKCDIASSQSYDYINTQMDILNYSDYFSTEFYLANTDWPANNIKWWKERTAGGKWRWALYDTDQGAKEDFDMVTFVLNSGAGKGDYPNGTTFTLLFRTLLKNDRFKRDFINRTAAFLNTQFEPKRALTLLEQMRSETEPYWKRDFQRWKLPEYGREYELTEMRRFADRRPDYLRQHMISYFKLGESVKMTLSSQRGSVSVNGISVGSSNTGEWFTGSPLTLSLTDTVGFVQWSDGVTTPSRTVVPASGVTLQAQFR